MADSPMGPTAVKRTLAIDLTGSRLGPVWRSVEAVCDWANEWPDDDLRQMAADYYEIPVGQVRLVQPGEGATDAR